MSARRRSAAIAGFGVLASAAVAATTWGGGGTGVAGAAGAPTARSTARVERTDLEEREELDGTLGYGPRHTLTGAAQGTITALAPEGSVVERGQALYEVAGDPVPLLYGGRPAWRALEVGVDDGADVRQLEENLVALGYAEGLGLQPDERYDWRTRAAVRRWQDDLGVEVTGRVELGAVQFVLGAVRVASHEVELGAPVQAGAAVLEVTGTTKVVTLEAEAGDAARFTPGAAVAVVLPGGRELAGTVADVGRVASGSSDGEEGGPGGEEDDAPTVPVTVALDDAAGAEGLDGAPVEVAVTSRSREGVLAVPVQALLALPGGGYGVEVVSGSTTSVVAVETGMFAEGLVEVSGTGIEAGTEVVVAS